jgi:hypothetical protein
MDGIFDPTDSGQGSGPQTFSAHDRGIKLLRPIPGIDRAAPGIEQGVVFQRHNRCLGGLKGGMALLQQCIARHQSGFQTLSITCLLFRGHAGA